MPNSLESALSERMRNYFRKHGWFWRRIEAIIPPGIPDVFIGKDFHCCWIELKSGYGNRLRDLSPEQVNWHFSCWKAGVPSLVLTAEFSSSDTYTLTCGRIQREKQNPALVEWAPGAWIADFSGKKHISGVSNSSLSDYIKCVCTNGDANV